MRLDPAYHYGPDHDPADCWVCRTKALAQETNVVLEGIAGLGQPKDIEWRASGHGFVAQHIAGSYDVQKLARDVGEEIRKGIMTSEEARRCMMDFPPPKQP